jgi:hypothetical protein
MLSVLPCVNMKNPRYEEIEICWLLFYVKVIGISFNDVKLLHNKRFPNNVRTQDAIQRKVHQETKKMQEEGRNSPEEVVWYLLDRLGELDVRLRQELLLCLKADEQPLKSDTASSH